MGTIKKGLKTGLETTWILGKIIFPVTLIVTILSHTPLIDWVIYLCTPLMQWIGLPGEAAIPLVLTNLLNPYAGIGAILTLDLTVKEVFILAIMMSFSHNLLIETAVAAKVGIRPSVAIGVRLGLAIVSAILIHWLWQGGGSPAQYGIIPSSNEMEISGWLAIIWQGLQTAVLGILQVTFIVIPLMVLIQWLKDCKFLDIFTRWMKPVTKMLGLAPNTATVLSSGLLIGLAFGAGLIIQAVKEEHISKKDMYLLFIFLVTCHAVIEDTLIFIPLGIPVWPLLLIRLISAIVLTVFIAYVWNRWEKQELPAATSKGVQHDL